MQISLDGVTIVLGDEHMDKLTSILAEKLLPKLEENWARFLADRLANLDQAMANQIAKFEELADTVNKIESDVQDLESRIEDSDSKMDDFISSSDLDVDDVNNAVETINSMGDISDLETRIDQLEAGTSVKAIIEKIARILLENASVMA